MPLLSLSEEVYFNQKSDYSRSRTHTMSMSRRERCPEDVVAYSGAACSGSRRMHARRLGISCGAW